MCLECDCPRKESNGPGSDGTVWGAVGNLASSGCCQVISAGLWLLLLLWNFPPKGWCPGTLVGCGDPPPFLPGLSDPVIEGRALLGQVGRPKCLAGLRSVSGEDAAASTRAAPFGRCLSAHQAGLSSLDGIADPVWSRASASGDGPLEGAILPAVLCSPATPLAAPPRSLVAGAHGIAFFFSP